MQKRDKQETEENLNSTETGNHSDIKTDKEQISDESAGSQKSGEKTAELEQKNAELNDKYLRLYSDFDNYRKRTMKEKADIIKTAGEEVFKAILPIIDDFERALKANEKTDDVNTIKEGMQLIYNKLKNNVQQKGVIPIESIGKSFDADTMEAITHIPATEEDQKGKVIDEVEKGYKLGDKVIRFAKVIVAQ